MDCDMEQDTESYDITNNNHDHSQQSNGMKSRSMINNNFNENNYNPNNNRSQSMAIDIDNKPLTLQPIEYVDTMQCDKTDNDNKPRTLFSLLLDKRKQHSSSRANRNKKKSSQKKKCNDNENATNNYEDIQDKLSQEELRVVKDLKEISDSKWCARGTIVTIHLSQRLHNFQCTISPAEGYYRDGTFTFNIEITKNYPFIPPIISAAHPIFHPNINLNTFEIGLSILTKKEWKPVLSLNDALFALQLIFMQPNINAIDQNDDEDEEKEMRNNDDDGDNSMNCNNNNHKISINSMSNSLSPSKLKRKKKRNQFSFGLNNHKPAYIPNITYNTSDNSNSSSSHSFYDDDDDENEGIIQNMDAAIMFRDNPTEFESICQQIIRGGINMFGTNWQCIERKKMRNIFNKQCNNSENYDPSIGSQSFKLKNNDKTYNINVLTKKSSVLRKRRRNESFNDEDTFNMEKVKRALRCFASTTGSLRDGVYSDSSESQSSLINGVDNIEIQPPEKKRRVDKNGITEQDLNGVDLNRNDNDTFFINNHNHHHPHNYYNHNGFNHHNSNPSTSSFNQNGHNGISIIQSGDRRLFDFGSNGNMQNSQQNNPYLNNNFGNGLNGNMNNMNHMNGNNHKSNNGFSLGQGGNNNVNNGHLQNNGNDNRNKNGFFAFDFSWNKGNDNPNNNKDNVSNQNDDFDMDNDL